MARIFNNCQIVLDLTTSVSFKKKQEIRKKVIDNGGIISYIVTKKSTHVVCNDAEKADISYKCKMAQKYSIPVVSLDFLHECVDKGRLLNPDDYMLVGKTKSQELSSGKIVASKNQTSEKKKKGLSINVGGVKAWPYKDKNAPQFNEESYEVAKYSILKKFEKTRETTAFCVLEIHVVEEQDVCVDINQNPTNIYRFRVFSHLGNLHDVQEGKPGTVECRYVKTSEEALAVYAFLYKQQTGSPNFMTNTHQLLSQQIGSLKFQQMVSDLGLEQEMSHEVGTLVEHLWTEAAGELEEVISVPLKSLKLEQVEKAEALLLKLRECKSDDNEIESLLDEFYMALPHNHQHVVRKVSISWLAKKQDVCQLIKDMVSVSEATNWSVRGATDAKYHALRCNIEHLPSTHPQFKAIREHVMNSLKGVKDVTIHNIFSVHRQVEANSYRKLQLSGKTRLLFHASRAQHFVGILSRGLLLPKVVVDDFGGKRSDAGMLGNGIYFAESASTSTKYSMPSVTRGTRMMLVNEVALGECKDYYEYDKSLTSPPAGFDSVHGVARTDSQYSDFTEDEYVIYSTNQQMMKYLVEFTMADEVPNHRIVSLSQESCLEDDKLMADKIDLADVQNITDPMTKVTPGLVAGKSTVELTSVHIRAKLLDLAAEVIVFQEYVNLSTDMLEAKYIFPLDEAAAVCGFEAFINGKHVVGEVKEKETAHKEYKQAISEGHGAYLMDQDEETPDVFTVSVGNIPPGAMVLIKITYVSELPVEDEMISFRLPGSVAPWKKQETKATLDNLEKTDINNYKQNTVEVSVQMPFQIRSIECPTHKIEMKKTDTKAVIRLASDQLLDSGFHLLIGCAEIHVPRMWVERQSDDRHKQACMLTFYPEFEACDDKEAEVILTLDLSNSMKGTTLTEAKKILLLTLKHLPKNWNFNVVVFGTTFRELFPASQPNKKQYVTEAEEFIQATSASLGNTEVYRPFQSFYLLKSENSLRNIFLVSDGHINNEETTLNAVYKNSHHTRIFTFGVSSTQNRHLLRALARVGAGAFESFDSKSKSKWESKVMSQLAKAGQPGLTSVSVDWEQHDSDVPPPKQAPNQITALFSGSRQVVYGFVDNCLMATLRAEIAGQEISTLVSTSELNVTNDRILHRLTAKALIRDWEDGVLSPDRINHEVMKMNLKKYVIELSKEYCIVTQLTSFVAVEKREKDEIFDVNPDIEELLQGEDVDILDYMPYRNTEGKRLDSISSTESLESADTSGSYGDIYDDIEEDIYEDIGENEVYESADNYFPVAMHAKIQEQSGEFVDEKFGFIADDFEFECKEADTNDFADIYKPIEEEELMAMLGLDFECADAVTADSFECADVSTADSGKASKVQKDSGVLLRAIDKRKLQIQEESEESSEDEMGFGLFSDDDLKDEEDMVEEECDLLTFDSVKASGVKKDSKVMMGGKVCEVVATSSSKTGKHGHAKVHMVGKDVQTGERLEEVYCALTEIEQVQNVPVRSLREESRKEEKVSLRGKKKTAVATSLDEEPQLQSQIKFKEAPTSVPAWKRALSARKLQQTLSGDMSEISLPMKKKTAVTTSLDEEPKLQSQIKFKEAPIILPEKKKIRMLKSASSARELQQTLSEDMSEISLPMKKKTLPVAVAASASFASEEPRKLGTSRKEREEDPDLCVLPAREADLLSMMADAEEEKEDVRASSLDDFNALYGRGKPSAPRAENLSNRIEVLTAKIKYDLPETYHTINKPVPPVAAVMQESLVPPPLPPRKDRPPLSRVFPCARKQSLPKPTSAMTYPPPPPALGQGLQKSSSAMSYPPPPPGMSIPPPPPPAALGQSLQQSASAVSYPPPPSGMSIPPPPPPPAVGHSLPYLASAMNYPSPPPGMSIPPPPTPLSARGSISPPQSDLVKLISEVSQQKSQCISFRASPPPASLKSRGFRATVRTRERADEKVVSESAGLLPESKQKLTSTIAGAPVSWRVAGIRSQPAVLSVADETLSTDAMWVQDKDLGGEQIQPLLARKLSKRRSKISVPIQPQSAIATSESSKGAADFGIGSKIPHVVQKTLATIDSDLVDILASLQLPDGHWVFTEKLEKALGLSSDVCLQGLYAAGLKSLGHMVTMDIEALITTVLVIFILLKMHSPASFPIDFSEWNWKQKVMKIVQGLAPVEIQAMVLKAISYYESVEKSYPWVSGTLELGHNWFHVAQKMVEC